MKTAEQDINLRKNADYFPRDEWDPILNYTSGTTGDPKGFYHHRGAHLMCLKSDGLKWGIIQCIYGLYQCSIVMDGVSLGQ